MRKVVDVLVKDYSKVEFETDERMPDLVGITIGLEEPSTLWIGKEAGRVVWQDLFNRGYVKGIL